LFVDYQQRPENPYPAAIEDAIEALEWVHSNGKSELGADLSKLAVSSAQVSCPMPCCLYSYWHDSLFSGGNLTAIIALKASDKRALCIGNGMPADHHMM